jgi:uncharacterized RDD family membrane protein YckC
MSPTPHEEPALFDLPLAPRAASGRTEPPEPAPARRARRSAAEMPESLPLFDDDEPALAPAPAAFEDEADRPGPAVAPTASAPRESPLRRAHAPRPVALAPPAPEPPTAGLASRLRGAVGDLAVLAAVGTLALGGLRALGVPFAAGQAPGLAVFLLAWSFLYFVISLAFWGQTPGMAWAGVIARTDAGEALSFGQTARRWAGAWLTWSLAGLPGLLALTGRSLADRLSGSATYELSAGPSAVRLGRPRSAHGGRPDLDARRAGRRRRVIYPGARRRARWTPSAIQALPRKVAAAKSASSGTPGTSAPTSAATPPS